MRIPCISMLPPSFIDYALSRDLADGVLLSGCRKGECHYRLGPTILEQRIARERDPGLPRRVPRERVKVLWASKDARKDLDAAISVFTDTLEGIKGEDRRVAVKDSKDRATAKTTAKDAAHE